MRLVDLQTLDRVVRVAMLELVLSLGRWVPEPSIVDWRNIEILSDSGRPSWKPVDRFTRRSRHGDLDHRVVGDSTLSILGRDVAFPDAKLGLGHGVCIVIPAVC